MYKHFLGFNKQKILYGTSDGHVGLVNLSPENGTIIWEISTKSASGMFLHIFVLVIICLRDLHYVFYYSTSNDIECLRIDYRFIRTYRCITRIHCLFLFVAITILEIYRILSEYFKAAFFNHCAVELRLTNRPIVGL